MKILKKFLNFLVGNKYSNIHLVVIVTLLFSVLQLYISWFWIKQSVDELKQAYTNQDIQYEVYNEQSWFVHIWTNKHLINEFFQARNEWDYARACSLRSTLDCQLNNKSEFAKWADNVNRKLHIEYRDWQKITKIWDTKIKLENTNSRVYCVEYKFFENHENREIRQIDQYTITKRPSGGKEISRILCEKAYKIMEKSWIEEDRTIAMCKDEIETSWCMQTYPKN